MIENKNQPAFPVNEDITDRIDSGTTIYTGLSKREYLAGLAMQGLLANHNYYDNTTPLEVIARDSVAQADALLNELSKPQP